MWLCTDDAEWNEASASVFSKALLWKMPSVWVKRDLDSKRCKMT